MVLRDLKGFKERGGVSNCLITDVAQLLCTEYVVFLLARGMSVLLWKPIGNQAEIVQSAVLC